jgi:hypothetical protein
MKPDDLSAHVSYETIYAAIYAQPRGGLKAAMIEALRQRSVVPTGEHKTASFKSIKLAKTQSSIKFRAKWASAKFSVFPLLTKVL